MCRITKQCDTPVIAHPPGQWVSVHELPINYLGSFLDDGFADWIPSFNDLIYVFELAREGPGFFDIGFVLVFGNDLVRF
jgi:hypothetical protein